MTAYYVIIVGNIVIKTPVVYINIANSQYYWYVMLT